MPTYEKWELRNAASYLQKILHKQFPPSKLSVVKMSLDKNPKTFSPVIMLEVKANELPPGINQHKLNLSFQKIRHEQYHCKVEKVDDIESLIQLANKKACHVLNSDLECTREGASPWKVYPPGKPTTSDIPHLRCYATLADPTLARACLCEVMEKMTGRVSPPENQFKENERVPCPILGGKLSFARAENGTYYLDYQEYSLEKLMKNPLLLYLFSSLEELAAYNVTTPKLGIS